MYSEEVGNAVLIGHLLSEEGFAYFTVYLHLEDIKVERGQEVRRGEHIGTAGSTGGAGRAIPADRSAMCDVIHDDMAVDAAPAAGCATSGALLSATSAA